MSDVRVHALALTGNSNLEIAAVLGRPLTPEEKDVARRARVQRRLERAQPRPDKVTRFRQRDRVIPYVTPSPAIRAVRTRKEKDVAEWLRYYLPDRFPLPFGKGHFRIIEAAERARANGLSITVAAPRGEGKTSVLWGICLYWVLTGQARFPMMIGWTHEASKGAIDQWITELSQNERLRAAYPCVCDVFAHSTAATRLDSLTREIGADKIGASIQRSDGKIIIPDQVEAHRTIPRAVLGSASINGSVKGVNVSLITGENLRPDIAVLDDPQDVDTAQSEARVRRVIKNIDFGVRSLAGTQERITIMAAVTCVAEGDVAEQLLEREGTEAVRYGQIISWPEDFHESGSEMRAMWDEWNDIRVAGIENTDGGAAARAHYTKHRTKLTKGMEVSWEQRRARTDPDAFYTAMWDYYDLGEYAFMAERQNAPVKEGTSQYILTPEDVISRTDPDRRPNELPDWVTTVVALTDINRSYALTTVVLGFGANQTSVVLDYWQRPLNARDGEHTPAEVVAIVHTGLGSLGKEIAQRCPMPRLWVIDGMGTPAETVNRFAGVSQRVCGIPAIAAYGRGARNYRPTTASKGRGRIDYEEAHVVLEGSRRWIIWNADYWREQAQRAWTGTPGAPGTCELPAGRHYDFAAEVCREQLKGKDEVGGKMLWLWTKQPGPNDYGDCMAMGYMAAGVAGIGTGGAKIGKTRGGRRSRARAPGIKRGKL